MKPLRYLTILLCLLLYSPVQAEEGRYKYGEVWNSWTKAERHAYLKGLKDGMKEGFMEYDTFMFPSEQEVEDQLAEKRHDFLTCSVSLLPFDIGLTQKMMTRLYADPSNTYLEFRDVFLVSVAKTGGSSPEFVEKLLARARKESYAWHVVTTTKDLNDLEKIPKKDAEEPSEYFRDLVYEEIYKAGKHCSMFDEK